MQPTSNRNSSWRHPVSLMGVTMIALLGACQTAQMPVPETLAAAPRMNVQGRQGWKIDQRLRFGPYEANDVSRSWTRGGDIQVRTVSASGRRQNYAFTLREGGQERWRVECDANLVRAGIEVGGVEVEPLSRSALECRLNSLDGAAGPWFLTLTEQHERPLAGTVRSDTRTLQVQGTNRLERSLPAGYTTGYEIGAQGGTLAAVEVVNAGAVWLQPGLDPVQSSLLSAVAAALLLLEDLRETLASS